MMPHSYPWLEVDLGKINVSSFFALQNMATLIVLMYCTPITRKSQENEMERGNSVNEWRVHKITHVGALISIG